MQRDDFKGEAKEIIRMKNLRFQYDGQAVLEGISTSLNGPKIYGLLGRNGAGKTTLLSLINGYINGEKGSLKIFGQDPFDNRRVSSNVSYHGKPNFKEVYNKVKEQLALHQKYRQNFDMDYAKKLLEDFQIPLNKNIRKLSQGKQSALNGILGLASGTAVTLLDEVYAGMDAPARTRMYNAILNEQTRRPRLMILSTHMVSEMDYLFDHVLILKDGKLVEDAAVDEILEKGITITGVKAKVDGFTKDLNVLKKEGLGNIQKAMVYEKIKEEDYNRGLDMGLEFDTTPMQELFIHLTEEGSGDMKGKGKDRNRREDEK